MNSSPPTLDEIYNNLKQEPKQNYQKPITILGLVIVFIAAILGLTLEQIYISQLVFIPGILLILFVSYKSLAHDGKERSRNYKYLIGLVATLQVILATTIINKHLLG